MKNLKYAYKFLLALPLIFMVGCVGTDDYEDILSKQTTQESTVFIETDDTSETMQIVSQGVAQSIEVGVNNASSQDITVSFNVTKDGSNAEEGVDYMLADATIYASDVTGSTDVTFLTEGLFEITISGSSASSLVIVDNKAIFAVPSPVEITVTLKWDDPVDLDLEFDAMSESWGYTGTIAGSYGYTNTEVFTLDIVPGNYAVWITQFGFTGNVDYSIDIEVNGNPHTTVSGTATNTGWWLWMTLERDANLAPVFTFFEEDPS